MSKFIFLSLIFLFGCGRRSNQSGCVALVNEEKVGIAEVDDAVKYELYETLQRIYVLRKASAENIINQKLINLEAKANNLSVEDFLKHKIQNQINDASLKAYVSLHHLDSVGMPSIKEGYKLTFPTTAEGKLMVYEQLRLQLMQNLTDSLRRKYKYEILLTPPVAPLLSINDIPLIYFKGDTSLKKSIIIVSDYDCENCREFFPVFQKIIAKYLNKAKIGYTFFSQYPTISAIYSEAAGNQNKFWEFHDALFKSKINRTPDSSFLFSIAKNLNLDVNQFRKDINDSRVKQRINNNIENLRAKNIYATPTVIVNGKIVLDIFNEEKLFNLLEKEIN
jgi:protein-disulfide isomerase